LGLIIGGLPMDHNERAVPGGNSGAMLDSLHERLDELFASQAKAEELEADLKAVKSNIHVLQTQKLPDMMDELGIEEIVRNGWKAEIGDIVRGNLPEEPEKRAAALQWLRENEGEPLIKHQITIELPKGNAKLAERVVKAIAKLKVDYTVAEGVHSSTLQSFAREKFRNGEKFPAEELGIYVSRAVKAKPVKAKAKKSAA
jgi:hypothetical protein